MVHVQKRISVGLEVVQFFTMRKWHFRADNFEKLNDHTSKEEYDMFGIDTCNHGDESEYLKNSLLGARQYCVKDPLSTLPRARLQLKM